MGLFEEIDSLKIDSKGQGEGYTCEGLVDFDDLGPIVPKYLSSGLWLEAVQGVLQNEEIEISTAELTKRFSEVDTGGFGTLIPSQVITLLMSLGKNGIDYKSFHGMITQDMQFKISDRKLRLLFNTVDIASSGGISEGEFVSGFKVLIGTLLPHMILQSLRLLPEQVVPTILGALLLLLLIFAFLTLSMQALTPDQGGLDVQKVVQAIFAAVAALGINAKQTGNIDVGKVRDLISAAITEVLPMVKVAKK